MKKIDKILVPSDYSDFAKRAAKLAIEIGNQFESQITLYHLYTVPTSTGSFTSVRAIIEADALKDMKQLERDLRPLLKGRTSLNTKVVENYTADAICKKAKSEGYDLIVMGTKGASGLNGILMGSVAKNVLKKTQVPLLVVPEEAALKALKNIVLALDDDGIKDGENLALLCALLKSLEAKLHIVHIEAGIPNTQLSDHVFEMFKDVDYEYTNIPATENINQILEEFAELQRADLLCMIRRKRPLLQRILGGSHTTKEVMHSKNQLLLMQE